MTAVVTPENQPSPEADHDTGAAPSADTAIDVAPAAEAAAAAAAAAAARAPTLMDRLCTGATRSGLVVERDSQHSVTLTLRGFSRDGCANASCTRPALLGSSAYPAIISQRITPEEYEDVMKLFNNFAASYWCVVFGSWGLH
jgi:hypothetical protein